jgi:hypothetical protein
MGADGAVTTAEDPALERCGAFVDHQMHEKFSMLGLVVGRHPWKTIAISLLVSFACMSGFTMLESESRSEELWVPTGTDANKETDLYKSFFTDDSVRFAYVIAVDAAGADTDDGAATQGMLADGKLQALLAFHDALAQISVTVDADTLDEVGPK